MKIINTVTNETIAEIITNHSMTLDESIESVGRIFNAENPWDENVEIDGKMYFYDDLDMVWEGSNE